MSDDKESAARGDTMGDADSSRTAASDTGVPDAEWNPKPETAREALARWDRGDSVFTAEMGGLGPGYEQVIHIMAFEIIRELLTRTLPDFANEPAVKAFAEDVERAVMPKIRGLGSSGAQWGAAVNVAYRTVRFGWKHSLDELPPDRLIQVSQTWPRLEPQPTPTR